MFETTCSEVILVVCTQVNLVSLALVDWFAVLFRSFYDGGVYSWKTSWVVTKLYGNFYCLIISFIVCLRRDLAVNNLCYVIVCFNMCIKCSSYAIFLSTLNVATCILSSRATCYIVTVYYGQNLC